MERFCEYLKDKKTHRKKYQNFPMYEKMLCQVKCSKW